MAKHNLMLGTASGSVGDVTIYRREGVQVNRARVREIANPKTNAQATQRNFLAPVAKFYAPLASVLEKSYEGLNKSKSYSAFLKKNIDLARRNGWYLPKGTPFFPLPYQVSRGTIQPVVNELVTESNQVCLNAVLGEFVDGNVNTLTVGQFAQSVINQGYREGDQVTIILIGDNGEGEYFPQSCRFYLEPESTVLLKDVIKNMQLVAASTDGIFVKLADNFTVVAGVAIISRYDNNQWRRSTQTLMVDENIMGLVVSETQATNAIRSYQDNNYAPTSEVYLNGGDDTIVVETNKGRRVQLKNLVFNTQGNEYVSTVVSVGNTAMAFKFFNQTTRQDPHYNFYLKNASSWSDTAPERLPDEFIPITSYESELVQWLMSKGIAPSVFQ